MSELERNNYINPLIKSNGQKEHTHKQVRDFMVASVKEFIKIFKWSTFKFYKIQRYMRSQEDMLDQAITESVLFQQVSSVLIKAAEKQLGEEMINFKQALG